jgi:hypothetical protein
MHGLTGSRDSVARALEADRAPLALASHDPESVQGLAAWSTLASHDGLPPSNQADGFVGRAHHLPRAAVEPIHPPDPRLGAA